MFHSICNWVLLYGLEAYFGLFHRQMIPLHTYAMVLFGALADVPIWRVLALSRWTLFRDSYFDGLLVARRHCALVFVDWLSEQDELSSDRSTPSVEKDSLIEFVSMERDGLPHWFVYADGELYHSFAMVLNNGPFFGFYPTRTSATSDHLKALFGQSLTQQTSTQVDILDQVLKTFFETIAEWRTILWREKMGRIRLRGLVRTET